MSGKYNIIKAASFYTLCNILVKGASFITLPLFTSLMSPSEYGVFSVYISYETIFLVIVQFGVSATVRIAKYERSIDFDLYISTVICIPVVISFLGLVVITFMSMIGVNDFFSLGNNLWYILIFDASCCAISNIITAKLVIESNYKLFVIYSVSNTLLNISISLFLCYSIYSDHEIYLARIIGQFLSNLICTFGILFFTRIIPRLNGKYLRISIIWAVPLLFHTISTVILTQSDRIIINAFEDYSSVGIYSISVSFIVIPLTLYTSLENAWAPWFYQKFSSNDFLSLKRINNLYIEFFSFFIVIFMVVSPEIITIFTNHRYWMTIYCLIPLSLSIFFEMIYSLPVSIEYYNKKTTYIMFGTILVTVLNIILNIIFIKLWGYIGVAYATSLSKLLLFIFHYFLAKTLCSKSIFDSKVVVCCSFSLFLVCYLTIIFINNYYIRWVGLLIVLVVFLPFFYNAKRIIRENS